MYRDLSRNGLTNIFAFIFWICGISYWLYGTCCSVSYHFNLNCACVCGTKSNIKSKITNMYICLTKNVCLLTVCFLDILCKCLFFYRHKGFSWGRLLRYLAWSFRLWVFWQRFSYIFLFFVFLLLRFCCFLFFSCLDTSFWFGSTSV